jgi:hypothetical protein
MTENAAAQKPGEDMQSLEVIIRTLISVPMNWRVEDAALTLPDGRTVQFWPELELFVPDSEEWILLPWVKAEELGVTFDEYTSGNRITVLVKEPG